MERTPIASPIASPRTGFSAEEKKLRDERYRVDVKQFAAVLSEMVQFFHALVVLNTMMGGVGKGAYLGFPTTAEGQQGYIPFNKKHMRSANALFTRELKALKHYLRVSKKKTRERVRPESFSATFTPLYAGEALRFFFSNQPQKFGPLSPSEAARTQSAGQALMDVLPMVKEGYLLRNTITMLFFIYAHTNQLQAADNAQFVRSDEHMTESFGGQIPATFFTYKGVDGKSVKVQMAQAVASGLIPQAYNTYQVVQANYPSFDPGRFPTYFYQNIAAANYYTKTALAADPALAEVTAALQQDDVRSRMLQEHNIIKQASKEWTQILEPTRKANRDSRKKQQDLLKRQQRGRV